MTTPIPEPDDVGWVFDDTVVDPTSAADPSKVALARQYAATTIRALTLRRVGGRPITVMPCGERCHSSFMQPFVFNGKFYNVNVCSCDPGCNCGVTPKVELPAPVYSVSSVVMDGVTVDPSAYRVENWRSLVRTDGDVWPVCSSDGFTVTYTNGYPVDAMGMHAGSVLAAEFLKALTGNSKCRLPANITGITRQGVSLQITSGMFPGGFTGISEVDSFIRLWNPNGLTVNPTVSSVDTMDQPRQITWSAP